MLLCLGLVAWNGIGFVQSAAVSHAAKVRGTAGDTQMLEPPGTTACAERAAELRAFLDALTRLRQNDASIEPEITRIAAHLCSAHQRCDVEAVLAYYMRLTPAERERGRELEARFDAAWKRVRDARGADLAPATWATMRDAISAELEDIARDALDEADFVPAARAQSLWARLAVERLRTDAELDETEQSSLLSSAREHANASVELFERAGHMTPALEPLWLEAELAKLVGADRRAASAFERCLALARHVSRPDFEQHALRGFIELAQRDGDLATVGRWLQDLAQISTPAESWYLTRKHAELLLAMDQPDVACSFLERYPPSDASEHREWRLMLGGALLRSKKFDQAREKYLADGVAAPDVDLKLALGSLELSAGDAWNVVEEIGDPDFLETLTVPARARALEMVGAAYVRLKRPQAAIGALSLALKLFDERELSRELAPGAHDRTASVMGEVVGMHCVALLAGAHAELGNGLEAARVIEEYQSRILRDSVRESGERTDSSSRTRTDSQSRARAGLTADDLRRWAAAYELGLVTWVIGADSSVVAHVAPDGSASAWPLAHGRLAVEHAVRRLREAAIANDMSATAKVAHEIQAELAPRELWDRVASMPGTGDCRLLFLLHGPLESLPVDLFDLDDSIRERRVVSVVLPGLPECSPEPSGWSSEELSWSLLGAPVTSTGRSTLPGAEAELVEVAALHDAPNLCLGERFDRSVLSAALRGKDAVHIATHLRYGCGGRGARLSDVGLELAKDDVFSAEQILECRPELPLVVLAACETNQGRAIDAEGLQGLARAFLESGTRNLLVTLWPVEDQATSRFALEFHRALAGGETPSRAAAAARDALREAGFGPADWAAFRLVGRD